MNLIIKFSTTKTLYTLWRVLCNKQIFKNNFKITTYRAGILIVVSIDRHEQQHCASELPAETDKRTIYISAKAQ